MYYWCLLNKSDDELAKKFYYIQKEYPSKDDWALDIQENLEFCEIDLTEDEIKNMKKEVFKK